MQKKEIKDTSLFQTKEKLIINMSQILECDESPRNKNIVNNLCLEPSMEETAYIQFERDYNGFKVIVEFPNESKCKDSINGEVKQLMSSLLHEQLLKIV